MKTLSNYIEILEDPRDIRGKKHKLSDILIMTIYGVLCGYTDFVNMTAILKIKTLNIIREYCLLLHILNTHKR